MSWTVEIQHLDIKCDGDATLIIIENEDDENLNRTLLIDGGKGVAMTPITNAVETYLPEGRRQIDIVVVTHYHADHAAGIARMSKTRKSCVDGARYVDRGAGIYYKSFAKGAGRDRDADVHYFIAQWGFTASEGANYIRATRDQRINEIKALLSDPQIWPRLAQETSLGEIDLRDIDRAHHATLAKLGIPSARFGAEANEPSIKRMLVEEGYEAALAIALNDSDPDTQEALQSFKIAYRPYGRYLSDSRSSPVNSTAAALDACHYTYDAPEILTEEIIWHDQHATPDGAPTLTCVSENRYFLRNNGGSKFDDDTEASAENAKSLGFILEFNNFRYFLGGDLEHSQELTLGGDVIANVDVLKLSHHGSQKSTFIEFLDRTKPVVAIVSNSDKNTFAFPDIGTQSRLKHNAPDLVHFFMTGAPKTWLKTRKAVVMGNGVHRRGDVGIIVSEEHSRSDPAEFRVVGHQSTPESWRGQHFLFRQGADYDETYQRGIPVPYTLPDEPDEQGTRPGYVAADDGAVGASGELKRVRKANDDGRKRARTMAAQDDDDDDEEEDGVDEDDPVSEDNDAAYDATGIHAEWRPGD